MAEALDPKLVDKRTAERYLREGILDPKAYERLLKSLPDIAEKAQPVQTSMADEDEIEDSEEETPSE
jgi:hypothetical protein